MDSIPCHLFARFGRPRRWYGRKIPAHSKILMDSKSFELRQGVLWCPVTRKELTRSPTHRPTHTMNPSLGFLNISLRLQTTELHRFDRWPFSFSEPQPGLHKQHIHTSFSLGETQTRCQIKVLCVGDLQAAQGVAFWIMCLHAVTYKLLKARRQ